MGAGPPSEFELVSYNLSPTRGFLPHEDPLTHLPPETPAALRHLESLAAKIPDLLASDELRPTLDELPVPTTTVFEQLTRVELRRLYTATGFLASAYVHKIGADTSDHLPAGIAIPLVETTSRLNRPPILSYDAYALYNWTRRDPARPLTPHNLETITNFVDLPDEEWFIIIHVAIESKAATAITALPELQLAVADADADRVVAALWQVEDSLRDVVSVLERMPEHNSPVNYGPSFRPYIHAFENVEYNGVNQLEGPQSFRGETGAQSALFPALDGGLGIDHRRNPLSKHVSDMRVYMPPNHRQFVADLESGPDVHAFVRDGADDHVVDAYNSCIEQLIEFREIHNDYAHRYILEQIGDHEGTGGTPYARFLDNLIDDTQSHRIEP